MIIQRKRVAKRLASGLLAGALALGGLAISGGPASAKTPVVGSSAIDTDGRVGGLNRWETATAAADAFLARRGSLGTWNSIVVASGTDFPDALAASGLAGALNAPVILLPSDGSMPTAVSEWAISRRVQIQANSGLGTPFTVYVIGGETAVPAAGVDTLMSVLTKNDATPAVSTRIEGKTRAETAQKVALAKSAAGANLVMSPAKPVFLVNQNSFADALSIAAYAFNAAAPVLLTSSSALSAEAAAVLSSYRLLGGSEIVILGGTSAVSTQVELDLVGLGFGYASISRVYGADRYETSVAIADWVAAKSGNFNNKLVTFTNGEGFADGLAGAPVTGYGAANAARALVLVKSDAVPTAVQTWLATQSKTAGPTNMYVLGGTSAVTAAVPTAVTAATTAINTTSSMTCVYNNAASTISLLIPGNVTGATVSGVPSLGNEAGLINTNQFLVDGSPNGAAAGLITPVYDVVTNTTIGTVTVSSVAANKTISWPGLTELQNTAVRRVIGGSSCLIASDTTGPTASIDARVQGATGELGAFYVTFSEVATGFAINDITTSISTVSATASTVTQVGTSATWKVVLKDTVANTGIKLQAGDIVTVAANAVADPSQNTGPAAAAVKTLSAVTDADVTAATLTGSYVCTQANQVILKNSASGTLRMTASAVYGPQGVAGNLYTFKVTNVRGQVIPKVTIDDATSSIVLSADLAYSTPNDVIKSMNNDGIVAWTFSSTGTATAAIGTAQANTAAATYLSAQQAGSQSCAITITGSENLKTATGAGITATVVVGGVSHGAKAVSDSTTSGAKKTIAAVTTIATPVTAGTISVTLSAALTDVAGNSSATLVAI